MEEPPVSQLDRTGLEPRALRFLAVGLEHVTLPEEVQLHPLG